MEQDILELKALIDKLREIDTEFYVFGAESHRYKVGSTLSESEIQAFERKNDILLPEDYRLYLKLVGNGNGLTPKPSSNQSAWQKAGAGPGYGIYPLESTIFSDQITRPFPFKEETNLTHLPDHFFDDWDEDTYPGSMEICTTGCSTHTQLIVKGSEYGTIWEGDDYEFLVPTNLSFSQWVRAWAEEKLKLFAYKSMIKKIRPGMSGKEVIKATMNDDWREIEVGNRTILKNPVMKVTVKLNPQKVVTDIYVQF